jgi:hypothetical protein
MGFLYQNLQIAVSNGKHDFSDVTLTSEQPAWLGQAPMSSPGINPGEDVATLKSAAALKRAQELIHSWATEESETPMEESEMPTEESETPMQTFGATREKKSKRKSRQADIIFL